MSPQLKISPKTRGILLSFFQSPMSMITPDLNNKLLALVSNIPTGKNLAKYLVVLVFLLNWRAWPFVWHIRIFKPLFIGPELERRWLNFTALFKTKDQVIKDDETFWTSHSPIGEDPFKFRTTHKTYTSFDDCDYNLHLSNSAYGKAFDCTRFKSALSAFPQYIRVGGFIPLAATHYHFIREIPMFCNYEIHATVGGWDHKWIYIIGQFVTPKKTGDKSRELHKPATPPVNHFSVTSLHTPAAPEDVYSPIDTPALDKVTNTPETLKNAATLLNQAPDGFTLNTVAISRLCFKVGRITVPPAIVMAMNGFTRPSDDPMLPYSHENPPPFWNKVLALSHPRHGGSIKKLRDFLKGGWREIPEGEKWWEEALSGPVEEQRKANMQALEAMRSGMDYFGTK